MAWEIVDVTGYISCKFPSNFLENVWEQNRELFVINSNNYSWTKGDNFWYMPDSPSGPTYFYERNDVKLGYQKYDSSSSLKYCNGTIYANGYYGGTSFNQVSGQNECTYAGFAFVKNDETQHAQVVVCWEFYFEQYNFYELHGYCAFGDWQIFPWLYNWVTNNLPIHYNWQSVKSLKGINDFSISLPVLSNINDGNPVSGASFSAFTKVPSAENNIKNLVDITLEPVATDSSATIFYTIPALKNDSYSSVKVYAKIGEVPKCDETDDIVEDIDPTINEISLENLEYETEYFFCIQSISNNGLKLSSNIESCITGEDASGTTFGFTESIQTFTAPETGTYQLETWGAQGQNDGSTRGGYGAYAKGDIWLNQGQTIYVVVGGQNGYNGGGNYASAGNIINIGVPGSGQAVIFNDDCWTQDYGTNTRITTMTAFAFSADVLDIAIPMRYDTLTNVWERNGVRLNVMKDSHTATYGGQYRFSFTVYDGDELIVGDTRTSYTYASLFYVFGFDRSDTMYNSNVQSRLQKINVALGVDHSTQQGYITICVKSHRGYEQGVYVNYDYYYSVYGDVNSHNINRAKLYNAIIKASQ